MTVEVGIINRKGAVLAADSFSTVIVDGRIKIITTDKIFAISKHHSVGIMVYDEANFTYIPWETVIKVYRSHLLPSPFDTLQEYADNFLEFLLNDKKLYDTKYENELVEAVLNYWLEKLNIEYKSRQNQNDYFYKTEGEIKSFSEKKFMFGFDENFILSFIEKHKQHLLVYINDATNNIILNNKTQENLVKLCAYTISKSDFLFEKAKSSGLVITGFGSKEIYPMICEYKIIGRVSGKLIYKKEDSKKIDTASSNKQDSYGYLFPFAQKEIIKAYIYGIDPKLREELEKDLKILDNLFDVIQTDSNNAFNEQLSLKYRGVINKSGERIRKDFEKKLENITREKFFSPFFTMINFLGKVELISLAEALVNLTITRRRFTTDEETVGGATDVAIITKGEGFIWVKKKEFVKPEINISDFI